MPAGRRRPAHTLQVGPDVHDPLGIGLVAQASDALQLSQERGPGGAGSCEVALLRGRCSGRGCEQLQAVRVGIPAPCPPRCSAAA